MASKTTTRSGNVYGNKTIYVRDHSVWEKLVAHAKAQNRSVSECLEDAIKHFVTPENDDVAKLQKIREILESK